MAFFTNDIIDDVRFLAGEGEADFERKTAEANRHWREAKEEQAIRRDVRAQMRRAEHPASGSLPTIENLSSHERRNYRLSRLLTNLAVNPAKPEMSLELEVSNSIGEDLRRGPYHGGFFVPLSLRPQASGLDSRTDSAGKFLTSPRVMDVVDAITARTSVLRLGGTFLTGLRFGASFPIESDRIAATWVDQNPGADIDESNPSFAVAQAHAHTLQAAVSTSREVLTQSSPALENWVRGKIGSAHGQALDYVAIHGSGLTSEPSGLLVRENLTVIPINADGGHPTVDHVIALEAAVPQANTDMASCGFLTNAKVRALLRASPNLTSGSAPLWADGEMLGYRSLSSEQLRSDLVKGNSSDCSPLVFGDWSGLLLLELMGALEIVVDPYKQKKQGLIEICSFGLYDICIPQAGNFAVVLDAK